MRKWAVWVKPTNGFFYIKDQFIFTNVDNVKNTIFYKNIKYSLTNGEYLVDVTDCSDFEKLKQDLTTINDIIS
jgi:hypothetical protein